MAHQSRELEIRALVGGRQPVPFVLANWLLAELDAARLRLSALEVELELLRTEDVCVQLDNTTSGNTDTFSQLPEWLTVAQFAQELGIGRGLAYDLVKRRDLKQVRWCGRLVRIHRDELRVVDSRAR